MTLLDEMNADVINFIPERSGESVEGVIVAMDVTSSEYTRDEIPVITLKQADGIYRGVRAFATVLRNELVKLELEVGDTLAVLYEGKKPTKDGKRTFHSYKVRSVKGDSAPASTPSDDVAPF